LDLQRENGPLHHQILARLDAVARSGGFVLGPECERLEAELANLCGVKHGVACASGSDALLLALMALDIQPGDEVIVPSFTFFATASAVSRLGAVSVFVDIDPVTFNLDPLRISAAVTARTRAIIPVHLYGQSADMASINRIARQHSLAVIEDAAQAIGAQWAGGPVCSWGTIGCLSFYPTKNLGAWGDAGLMLTSDDQLAERLRLLRVHGMKPRYIHREIGINSRLDGLQAAVLNVKLSQLAGWTEARRANAARYTRMFNAVHMRDHITIPVAAAETHHVWNQFTIRVQHGLRDALRQYLRAQGVGSEVYYPIPLHRQSCYQQLGYAEGSLPQTEQAAREVLSLPIFPQLTEEELETVVHHTVRFFESDACRLHDYRSAAA
jgi:dTDP-4-amino-4,6-dideoxygalactose transaminase